MKNVLQISKAQIEVHPNDMIEGGYFFDLRFSGILPNCRKIVTLHFTIMTGCLWITPLYGNNSCAHISPDCWDSFIRTLEVVPAPYQKELTRVSDELKAKARERFIRLGNQAREGSSKCQSKNDIIIYGNK